MNEKREPLTLEQLREMLESSKIVGAAVTVLDHGVECCGVLDERADDGICVSTGARDEWLKEKDYGKTWVAYAYKHARVDRSAWEPCELCGRIREADPCYKDGCFRKNAHQCDYRCNKFLKWKSAQRRLRNAKFCQKCGRPLTDAAWAELERRTFGGRLYRP